MYLEMVLYLLYLFVYKCLYRCTDFLVLFLWILADSCRNGRGTVKYCETSLQAMWHLLPLYVCWLFLCVWASVCVHFGVLIVVRALVFVVGGVVAMVALWCDVACQGVFMGGSC